MKLTLLIIFIAISILPSLLAYMKRGMVKETVVPEMEGEEKDNGFFGFDEENAAEEPAHEQSQYFTYETITSEDRKGRKAARMVEVPEEEQREAAFDLRQAVIYQTVLNNPYINTGNQINQ